MDGKRTIVDAAHFSNLLETVCAILARQSQKVFINARTDTFLLGIPNAVQETIRRAILYQKAGANGLFVPCIEKEEDIKTVLKGIHLPLNVMAMPNLPAFGILEALGVKRISMGGFVCTSAHAWDSFSTYCLDCFERDTLWHDL